MAFPSHLPLLAIDKSFAHASKPADLSSLADSYMLVVPDAFYHEIFTSAGTRRTTLLGFPDFRRIHLAKYLKRERRSGLPACSVKRSELPILSFNPDLLSPDWELSSDDQPVVNEYASHVVDPSIAFWELVIKLGVAGFSNEEHVAARTSPEGLLDVCATIREISRVRRFAAEIEFPHADKLDPSWFHFRMFQAWMLQGLILIHRYAAPEATPNRERIEHDLHDLEYLVLGLITENLATAETSAKLGKASMGWRFKFLCPDGRLVSPVHLERASWLE